MTTNDNQEPEVSSGPAAPGPGEGPTTTRPADPSVGAGFFDSLRRLGIWRSNDRWIGGVASGVAERYGLDPLLIRGLLILSVFVAGVGLVLYGIAWLLLPERSDGRIHLQETFRGTFDVAVLGAGLLILFGLVSGSGIWPWWNGPAEWIAVLLWIAFWVAVVWLIVKLVRSRRSSSPQPPSAPWSPAPEGTPPGAWQTPSGTATGTVTGTAAGTATGSPEPDAGFSPAPRAHYAPSDPASSTQASWSATAPAPTRWRTPEPLPMPPALAAPVPLAPPAPRPPRRRTPSAGFTTVGIVVGLSLLLGAGLLAADLTVGLALPVWSLWLALSTLVVGAAIVISGLRGRRGGWLSFLAVLALCATVATWPFADGRDGWRWDEWTVDAGEQITTMNGTTLSDGTVTPHSISSAEQGVRVQFGAATVDLTELDLSGVTPGDPVVVPIEMTAGRTVVEIPAGTPVEASVDVNVGTFVWDVDGQRLRVDGFSGGPATYRTDEVDDQGGAVLLLDVDARAGEFVIEESR